MANAKERFGGGWSWTLSKDQEGKPSEVLDIGQAITGEGPGEGHTVAPWVMDRYERVLGLRPGPAWLLKRLLKYAWDFKEPVFPSLRKIAQEGMATRRGLQAWMRELEKRGYAIPVGNDPPGRPRHYDVSGFFAALALCIAADPSSAWAKKRGSALPAWLVASKAHTGPGDRKIRFSLDFAALAELCGQSLELEPPKPQRGQGRGARK